MGRAGSSAAPQGNAQVRAVLHLIVEPGLVENVAERLSGMQRIADVFEVAGGHDLVALVSVGDLRELRSLGLRLLDLWTGEVLPVSGLFQALVGILPTWANI